MRNRHSPEIWILLLLATVIAVLTPLIGKFQQTADHVVIKVHFDQSEGPLRPIWNYFGYDDPNFTYAPNGKKLLGELAALHAALVLSEKSWVGNAVVKSPSIMLLTMSPAMKLRRNWMDVRTMQKPLKERYRQEPGSSRITLTAHGSQTDAPIACSVDLGRAIYAAQAHSGVGGAGTGACSGDLLLGALAACAQITCQMVAAAMGIVTESIEVTVEGDLDLQGTLGISKEVPVGFESIRVLFNVQAPQATPEQLSALQAKTEQYCVVMQTLQHAPKIENKWK